MALKMGREKENSYRKMKRSPEERHTQTHGNLIEIFWWSQTSFLIRIEYMYVNAWQRWHCRLWFIPFNQARFAKQANLCSTTRVVLSQPQYSTMATKQMYNKMYILTDITGMVRSPHAKNSRKMTTRAWYTLGSPIPDVCKKKKNSLR